MSKTKLSKGNIITIEEYWYGINQLRKDLKFREWELLEDKKNDENIGGGKTNRISDTTCNKALILVNDDKYQHLKKVVSAVEGVYDWLDDDQKTIVHMRYWSDSRDCFEWSHVADKLYMSTYRVLRKRNALIDETARRLGWV